MTAVGISNAIIGFAIVILVHGLLLPPKDVVTRRTQWESYAVPGCHRAKVEAANFVDTFTDSFVKPDPKSEMLDFANNSESWTACSVKLAPQLEAPMMVSTPCQRAESKYTDRTVVNTYENEMVSNGGDLGGGLRGYEAITTTSLRPSSCGSWP
jgi:hypothetical protein